MFLQEGHSSLGVACDVLVNKLDELGDEGSQVTGGLPVVLKEGEKLLHKDQSSVGAHPPFTQHCAIGCMHKSILHRTHTARYQPPLGGWLPMQ